MFDNLPGNYGVITPSFAMGNKLLNRLKENAGLSFELKITPNRSIQNII